MKRIIALALLVVGMNFGMTHRAAAQEAGIRVTVPFDFAVGNRILPSGTYWIAADSGFLSFNNSERKAFLFLSGLQSETSKDGRSVLQFDNVDGQYFLKQIISTSSKTSVAFPTSKLEKQSKEMRGSRNIYGATSSR